MLLLVNHLHKKIATESQDRQSFDSVHMQLFTLGMQLCSVTNLLLC